MWEVLFPLLASKDMLRCSILLVLVLVVINYLGHAFFASEHNLGLCDRALDTIVATHNFGYFFQCSSLGLDEEEINDNELERVPENEKEVIPPDSTLLIC